MKRNWSYLITLTLLLTLTSCIPNPETDYRSKGLDDLKLAELIKTSFGIDLPKGVIVLEAYSGGGRKPTGWFILSCKVQDEENIRKLKEKVHSDRNRWNSEELRNQFFNLPPKKLSRYFECINASNSTIHAYSTDDSTTVFKNGIIMLYVPERSWLILYHSRI